MAKYGKKAQDKVERAMHERKRGTLRSGGSGKRVTSRKQAIAIGLSEAREAGGKVPKPKSGGRKKKTAGAARKSGGARKSSTKKTTARKTTARKTAGRKKTGGRKRKTG